jgi:hypothetical protein
MIHEAELRRRPHEWTPQAYLKRLIAEGAPSKQFYRALSATGC